MQLILSTLALGACGFIVFKILTQTVNDPSKIVKPLHRMGFGDDKQNLNQIINNDEGPSSIKLKEINPTLAIASLNGALFEVNPKTLHQPKQLKKIVTIKGF